MNGVAEADMKLFAWLRENLPACSEVIREGGTSVVDQASLAGPLDLVLRAIEMLPNTSALYPTRDAFVKVGYAIRAALPDHPDAALDGFHGWAQRWKDGINDPDVVDAEWRRMKPPYRIGWKWLAEEAEKHSGGTFDRAEQWFETPTASTSLFAIEAATTVEPPLRAGRIDRNEMLNLPPRRWLYGFKASRGYVTMVASPGGVGKTAFVVSVALACAGGRPLLHDKPHGALKVWMYNLEDDRREILRRVEAARRHHGLPEDAVIESVRVNSGRDRRFRIVRTAPDGSYTVLPDYQAVIDEIRREGIDVLIVDPFLRSHGVSENDNEAQDEVMRLYAQIAEETGCAIILVHHTRKGAVGGELDSLRGGSAQGGGARSVLTLSPMSEDEAKALGLPDGTRRLFVRVDDAKNNMAPPVGRAEWLRLESVRLDNGDADYPDGDSVQVATRWVPPTVLDALGGERGVAVAREEEIIGLLDAGLGEERFSTRAQDRDRWAGAFIVERLGCSTAVAKEMLDDWAKRSLIEVRDYFSPSQRKTRRGIFRVARAMVGGIFD